MTQRGLGDTREPWSLLRHAIFAYSFASRPAHPPTRPTILARAGMLRRIWTLRSRSMLAQQWKAWAATGSAARACSTWTLGELEVRLISHGPLKIPLECLRRRLNRLGDPQGQGHQASHSVWGAPGPPGAQGPRDYGPFYDLEEFKAAREFHGL